MIFIHQITPKTEAAETAGWSSSQNGRRLIFRFFFSRGNPFDVQLPAYLRTFPKAIAISCWHFAYTPYYHLPLGLHVGVTGPPEAIKKKEKKKNSLWSTFPSHHVVLLLASNSPSNSPGSQIFHWHRRGSVSQVLWRGGRSDSMKFIELHLPVEAGKHNMHTDSEELSDSVSFDDLLTVIPDFVSLVLFWVLFWICVATRVLLWSEVYMFAGLSACLWNTRGFCFSSSREAVWWGDFMPCLLRSVCVFCSESCEGVCRWLNRTLYKG